MPLIHFIMLTGSLVQWLDYLKGTDFLNKYIKLLIKAVVDIE